MNSKFVEQLPLNETEHYIGELLIEQSAKEELTIGIFGSFSVGKSELLNRILETNQLLPTHTNETTALPTFLSHGSELKITKFERDGGHQEVSKEELHQYVAGASVDETEALHIEFPGPTWMENITFIDTPGRNTKYEKHIEASEQAIISSDAAIYVMPWQGLTMEDIVYLQKITLYQPNLYFVLNKIDRIDETQGVSIDDVCAQVQRDLKGQLGQEFPVFAVSAKTGERLEQFVESCIVEVANSTRNLKEKRFNHAMQQWLLAIQQRLAEETHLLEIVVQDKETGVEAEYNRIEIERQKIKQNVDERVQKIQSIIRENELNFMELIHYETKELKMKLVKLSEKSEALSEADLNLAIQHELLLMRQHIVQQVQNRLEKLLGEHVKYRVESMQGTERQITATEYNAEDIIQLYEIQKQEKLEQYEQTALNLQRMIDSQAPQDDRERIQQELSQLEEELNTEYVPQMVERVEKSSGQVSQAFQAVGFIADVTASVLLAAPTGGASVVAKLGGQGAAKAGKKVLTKATMKQVAKKVAREGAEKLAVRVAQNAANSSNTKSNKAVDLLTTIDKVTSPFETLARSIGETFEGEDRVIYNEDIRYRQQFFAEKSDIERKYENRIEQLEKLEKSLTEDAQARQLALQKLEQLHVKKQEEIQRQEKQMKEAIAREKQHQKTAHIEKQVGAILDEELEQYKLWIGLELDRAYQAVAIAIPQLAEENLNRWQTKLDEVVSYKLLPQLSKLPKRKV